MGPGASLVAGSTVEVSWAVPCPDLAGSRETELILSLNGGVTFPIRVTPEMAACATSFRWQVPALRTAHARLALRAGTGEGSESERLDFISEEFAILAGEAPDSEDLVRVSGEWWTRQALKAAGAEDLPLKSMTGAEQHLVVPDFCPDISEPNPRGAAAPEASAAAPPNGGARSSSISSLRRLSRPIRPTALRL